MAPQILGCNFLPKVHSQQNNNSDTDFGITQLIPIRQNTNVNNSVAPHNEDKMIYRLLLDLHIQYQSTIITPFFSNYLLLDFYPALQCKQRKQHKMEL